MTLISITNRELLDLYEACENEREVRQVEKEWLEKCEEEYQAVKSTGVFHNYMCSFLRFKPNNIPSIGNRNFRRTKATKESLHLY